MRWMRKPNTQVIVPKILMYPLPLPHPVCIAIEIYNRDSDDPIRLDDNICWDILRAVQESNMDVQVCDFIYFLSCLFRKKTMNFHLSMCLAYSL